MTETYVQFCKTDAGHKDGRLQRTKSPRRFPATQGYGDYVVGAMRGNSAGARSYFACLITSCSLGAARHQISP
jgi:hypothetical protein